MSDYLQWHADSERRYKAGQRQRQCKCCGRWFWRHEMREHIAKQLDALYALEASL